MSAKIMANFVDNPILSERFSEALILAAKLHQQQIRKQGAPYVSHLMSVAALVLENGGDEDEAIAALLHDAVEDVAYPLLKISQQFGERVAILVTAVSERETGKQGYIESIKNGGWSVALISAADKLHNLRGYCQTPHLISDEVRWFYAQLFPIYALLLGGNHPLVVEMESLLKCPAMQKSDS